MRSSEAIWHEVECGGYESDLPLWAALARRFPGPVLDVGCGSGRVALWLAAQGVEVVALDHDPELLAELTERAAQAGLSGVTTACADARDLGPERSFGLIIVPMQTIQLLGGSAGRARLLAGARASLVPGGGLAIALAEMIPAAKPVPLGYPPDVLRVGDCIYESRPTCVRSSATSLIIERSRTCRSPAGTKALGTSVQEIDILTAGQLEEEAFAAGLTPLKRQAVAPDGAYAGSEVVVLER